MAGGPQVLGVQVDAQTRCAHYHQAVDVIAIKHFCCGVYYPCHQCHEALADHPVRVWPIQRFDEMAVLCGVCRVELSVNQYLDSTGCPSCHAEFNPGCKLHRELYFGPGEDGPAGS